jgi:putative flavoprotein involved in K+ transport
LSRVDDGFLLVTPDGRHRARTVVVATGDANEPKVPPLAAELPSQLIQLHSAYYFSPDDLPPGAVLVVGGGQSGAQITEELLDAGRKVIMATSPVGRVPLWRRGHDAVRILIDIGFFDMPTADLSDPAMAKAPQPLLAPGYNLSLGRLERKGAVLTGRLVGVQGQTVTFAGNARAHAVAGEALASELNEVVDRYLAARGALDPIPPEEAEPLPTGAGPSAVNLARAGVHTVIWCTGYTGDFRWIEPGLLDDHGQPRRNGPAATDAPGLFYLGLRWLTMRGSGIFYGFGKDAERIADAIEARLAGTGKVGALSRL